MASLAGAFPMDSHFVFKDAQVIFNSRQIHITEVSELLPADSGGVALIMRIIFVRSSDPFSLRFLGLVLGLVSLLTSPDFPSLLTD